MVKISLKYVIHKYDKHKVKLLLWCLVVEKCNHVAPSVPVSSAYLNPQRIGSVRPSVSVCVCVCVCVCAVFCIGASKL